MTFISYAQNYEDVMLRRAFKDIKKGFYIDVGANDPVIDSVTKAFYDAGWHGINIEPVTEWFNKLQEARSNDTNLKLACGTKKGQNTIYDVVGTGLSTMDKSIADKHANELDFEIKKEKIKVDSLTNICKQHANQDIHFLKIDVEGFEMQVLKGLDLKKIRPWIIVVEATLPNSQIEDYGKWESILTNGQYNFVYFDGLNRFYVASEHDEFDDSFNVPPNYFDFFRRSSEQWTLDELKASEQKTYAKESEILLIAKDLDISNKELSEKNGIINSVKDELKASEQKTYAKESEILLIAKDLDISNKELSEKNGIINSVKDELKASEQKVSELNQSSHHWWLESERLNNELQAIYGSKSWRITWPLRKLMQFTTWLFYIPIHVAIWLVRLPKRTVRYLLVKLMTYVLKRPNLKMQARHFLRKYPKVEVKLRQLAMARQLFLVQEVVSLEAEPLIENKSVTLSESFSQLTPSARRVYGEIKVAMEQNRAERK